MTHKLFTALAMGAAVFLWAAGPAPADDDEREVRGRSGEDRDDGRGKRDGRNSEGGRGNDIFDIEPARDRESGRQRESSFEFRGDGFTEDRFRSPGERGDEGGRTTRPSTQPSTVFPDAEPSAPAGPSPGGLPLVIGHTPMLGSFAPSATSPSTIQGITQAGTLTPTASSTPTSVGVSAVQGSSSRYVAGSFGSLGAFGPAPEDVLRGSGSAAAGPATRMPAAASSMVFIVSGPILSIDRHRGEITVKDKSSRSNKTLSVDPMVLPSLREGSVVQTAMRPGSNRAEYVKLII